MVETKILVVDDEARMRRILRDFLVHEGYLVLEAENGEQALDIFCSVSGIDLIIMDVMMPVLDGYEASREIRKLSKVPILMLTAKSEERDELRGFEIGVDEYITKPFSPKILTARVGAILRRTVGEQDAILSEGGIRVDQVAHMVYVDDIPTELSLKEYELLVYFMQNKGICLSRDSILTHVWNYDYPGEARTIDTHVKKLRSKLGEKGDYIETIRGVGYKFIV